MYVYTHVLNTDGVVLIDPDYFGREGKKDRKGIGNFGGLSECSVCVCVCVCVFFLCVCVSVCSGAGRVSVRERRPGCSGTQLQTRPHRCTYISDLLSAANMYTVDFHCNCMRKLMVHILM